MAFSRIQIALISLGLAASIPLGAIEIGPLWYHFDLTLESGTRTEAAGPFWNRTVKDSELSWALPPFISSVTDKETDFTEIDFAYPLLSYDRFGEEYRFHVLQLFSFAGGASQTSSGKRRFTLFPFYFQQRSDNPEDNYTALMPFYGRLKNRLFRDEIRFIMLPAYLQTRKRDVVTDNYVYPLFHVRRGNGLHGWQFWPIAGAEHKRITTRTNGFDEIEIVGGHDKLFVLWPFFFWNNLGHGTDNPERQRVLLPFFSVQRSPKRDSTTYFWPFGVTITEDREKKFREVGAPWPLILFTRGEGKTVNRVWPLFSRASTGTLMSEFYLWPIYKRNRATPAPLDRDRKRIMLFLYSDLIERNTATGTALHRTDLWPLFTARKDHNGNERLQILAVLEPLLPNSKSIERNYSPLWSVWRSEKNAKTGARSQSFLWNLYRSDSTPKTRKCSLLFGLFQYQSAPEGKRWRMFYIPFGKNRNPPAQP